MAAVRSDGRCGTLSHPALRRARWFPSPSCLPCGSRHGAHACSHRCAHHSCDVQREGREPAGQARRTKEHCSGGGPHTQFVTSRASRGISGGSAPLRRELKQRVDKLLVIDVAKGLAACVERAVLSQRNHVIGGLADLLCAGEGGLNLAMTDQLGRERTQQRLALVSRLVELAEARAVALRRGGAGDARRREISTATLSPDARRQSLCRSAVQTPQTAAYVSACSHGRRAAHNHGRRGASRHCPNRQGR